MGRVSAKRELLRSRPIPLYPIYFTLEMVSEAIVFCERCETRVMGSVAAHLVLHGTLGSSIHAHHAVEDPPEYYSPAATSKTEQAGALQRYADAVFDLD